MMARTPTIEQTVIKATMRLNIFIMIPPPLKAYKQFREKRNTFLNNY